MEFPEFNSIIAEVKSSRPRLFELESSKIASREDLDRVEEYYDIKLPESYKSFLCKYGGGYFAYTVVYSCDASSSFYLPKNVSKEWVENNLFLPVIDFETGDFGGFSIEKGICIERFEIYLHDTKMIVAEFQGDFFSALLRYGLKQL